MIYNEYRFGRGDLYMAINRETTLRITGYINKGLVAKLDSEAMQRGIPRNQLINLILDAYFLDEETHEAEGVKGNEQK